MTARPASGSARFNYANLERLSDGRIFNPVCLRNNPPMVARLAPLFLNRSGPVLEIGAGTGQHAAAFALAFPDLDWWPSDPDPQNRISIRAWQGSLRAPDRPPLALDAAQDWATEDAVADLGHLTAVLSMNVIHVAPFSVTEGLFRGAAHCLTPDGFLLFYGPFQEHGRPTGPGNAAFDGDLRSRNPEWGIRDVEDLVQVARPLGFADPEIQQMPSDNRLLVFRRRP